MNVALRPQPDALNLISLCTGGGGLDRAVELAIPTARPIVCVERESFSVASLVAQIENGLMAPAAVWSNVRTFNGRRFRGLVDGLIGGIPCQGHSLAGRRQGSHDERDLWSPARRIIAQARPWFVLIENVGGMLSAGADEVAGAERVRRDLRKLGYSVTLVVVRADQMGLPHERLRVFILGVADWFVADDACGARRDEWNGAPRKGHGPGQLPDRGHGRAVCEANDLDLANAWNRGAVGEPGNLRSEEGADQAVAADGSERHPRNGGAGLGAAAGSGCGRESDSGLAPGGSSSAICELVDPASDGRREGRPKPKLRRGRGSAARAVGAVANSNVVELRHVPPAGQQPLVQQDDGTGGPDQLEDAARNDGGLHPGPWREGRGAADPRGPVEVVHALGGRRDGRPEGPLGPAQRRGPDERSGGRPFLRPPGPGDFDAWRHVALVAPELLPAVSRYDRLRLEMGAQGFVAHGDPSAGAWVDAQTGARVHSTVLQAATERAFRGVADVMAPRIDELRMLGNGVADAQGALAVRIGAHDLAARGSAGAALLVRLMNHE